MTEISEVIIICKGVYSESVRDPNEQAYRHI